MARAIWSGSISFGLVNIPIKVVGAVSDKDIHFNQLHEQDGARIKYKKVCSKDGEEVPAEDIVRGYEIRSGQYVTFTDEELEAADPKASRTIEIQDFVDLPEIDPAFFDKPYYLVPDKAAGKAYALLLAALKDTNKVGVARVVMHGKENLVALRALEGVLMMETMHFAEEVTPPEKIAEEVKADDIAVDKRQLELAKQIIDSLSNPFEPEKYENTHRKKVLELIEQKAEGKQVVVEPEVPVSVRTADLLGALEKSLAAAKTRHSGEHGKKEKVVAHSRKRGGSA